MVIMDSSKRKGGEAATITAYQVFPSNNDKRKKAILLSLCTLLLPDEMMLEVLLRLPVKSILRFRAVCRAWAALLSSKDFCSLHMAISKVVRPAPKLLTLVSPTAGPNSTAMYSCSPSGSRDDLLVTVGTASRNSMGIVTPSPCHGLTLLNDDAAPAYYVCNAATRAITRLPPHSTPPKHRSTAGLGFDALTREYKVVRLITGSCSDKERNKCEVYTPGAGCWRPAAGGGVPFRLSRYATSAIIHAATDKVPPVFANGLLHWFIDPSHIATRTRAAILTFSLTDETLGCVQSPPPFWTSQVHLWSEKAHLVVMDDQLCLVRDLRNTIPPDAALEIWKLLDYSPGEWSLYHRIHLFGHVGIYLLDPLTVRVIGVIGNCRSAKKIVITSTKYKFPGHFEQKLHTYDPSCQALETILSITETHTHTRPGSTFSLFEESLVQVHKPMDS
ncbi:putative F-box protein At2g02030 [Hordeum vulgare subsp. vulgare]|uniref:F-box domain-containing protein n=1 Tax=Hordeum vulgare subsp. vulgare TaxID=112509 RepID=A0A8I6WUC7_HORVV|nr:putative F-box protein At2g02030 [Hordeum vulgare subsp. vulgare]